MRDQFNRQTWGRALRAAALSVALAGATGAAVEAAPKDRFCAIPNVGPSDCSYSTIEACRAAHEGRGRCSPEEWLKPARRANTNAPAGGAQSQQARPQLLSDDARPKPRIDPTWTPSWIEGIGMSSRPGSLNNW